MAAFGPYVACLSPLPAAMTDAPDETQSETPQSNAGDSWSDAALGQRIREAREARQLTQQGTATRSKWADPEGKGISRTALIGYEAGTSRPGARELRILCQTLAVSANKLLFGTDLPVRTAHPALETIAQKNTADLRTAIELGFVMASLKGHERDALMSLVLSLAGRQLGDVRLAGLRMMAHLSLKSVAHAFGEAVGDAEDPSALTLEQVADALSRQVGSNMGTNLQFDDDLNVSGTWLYPDPIPDKSRLNVEKDDTLKSK